MFDDDDRGFAGPMFMLQALGPIMMMMAVVGLMFPLLLYVVARWRDHRSATADPQLGLKFALHFFRTQSYQLLMFGTTMLIFSILGKDLGEHRDMIYRPAFGLLVPAGIVFGVMSVMLGKTNNDRVPQVGRLFNGYNLMVTGIVGFVALVMLFEIFFQKGKSGNDGRMAWSAVLVYTTAWAVQGAMFGRAVLEAPLPYDAPPPPPAGDPRPEPMQKPLA